MVPQPVLVRIQAVLETWQAPSLKPVLVASLLPQGKDIERSQVKE